MSQIISKIGFYVIDKRHFDYYGNVLLELQKQNIPYELIINDQLSEVKKSVEESYDREMIEVAKQVGHPFRKLSNVIASRVRYKILITTFTFKFRTRPPELTIYQNAIRKGYTSTLKILNSFRSSMLSNAVRENLKAFDVSISQLPEQMIGEKIVQFPKGMDINLAKFPDPMTQPIIDFYLCHGNFDSQLVRERTTKPHAAIGYPRYDNLVDPELKSAKNLRTEFGIHPDKKIVTWLPTYVPRQGNDDFNIDSWSPIVANLTRNYAVIVRPHPKRVEKDRDKLYKKLSTFGFFVDLVAERDMSELYAGSAFTLCDYGGVVFSSVYTDQNLILLNHPDHHADVDNKTNLIVYQIREKLLNLQYSDLKEHPEKLSQMINDDSIWIKQAIIRNEIRQQYFGGVQAGEGSKLTAKILKEMLEAS